MAMTGRCYCGEVRYEADGKDVLFAQCHCRECQYISGGGPNFFALMSTDQFRYTQGTAKQFARSDLDNPRTRDFCPTCGTHLLTRLPGGERLVIKVGTLDDPAQLGTPQMAIFTLDMQPFHVIAEGVPCFERRPPQ